MEEDPGSDVLNKSLDGNDGQGSCQEVECLNMFQLKLNTHSTDVKGKIGITWTEANCSLIQGFSTYDWVALYSVEDKNNLNNFVKYKWIDKYSNQHRRISFTANRIGMFFFRYFVFDKSGKRIKTALKEKKEEQQKQQGSSPPNSPSLSPDHGHHRDYKTKDLFNFKNIKPITIQRPEVFKKKQEGPQEREHQDLTQSTPNLNDAEKNLFESLYTSPMILSHKTKDLVVGSPEVLLKSTKKFVTKTKERKDTIKRFHSESFLFISNGPYYLVAQSEPILVSPHYHISGNQISSEMNRILVETECIQISGNKDYSNCWIGLYPKSEQNNKAYVQFKWLSTIEAHNLKNRVVWELENEGEWEWRVFPLRKEYIHVNSFAMYVKEDTFDDIHERFAPPYCKKNSNQANISRHQVNINHIVLSPRAEESGACSVALLHNWEY